MEIEALIDRLEEVRNEIREIAKDRGNKVIFEIIQPIFEINPKLSVGWKQFIPSFNDGDACEFTVLDPYIITNNDGGDDYDELDSWTLGYHAEDGTLADVGLDENQAKALSEALKRIGNIMNRAEEFLEIAFGSHARVTVHSNGVVNSDYYEGY